MKEQIYIKNVVTLELDIDKCNGCMMCITVCPHHVFGSRNKKVEIIDKDACMECGACEKNCAVKAITVRSGVGCAAGIIRGTLSGSAPTCDCGKNNKNKCC